MRLIDADGLWESLNYEPWEHDADRDEIALPIVNAAPTVDAVPVVRCKDCRWRGIEKCAMFYRCECGEQHTWETDNDFCSYGERKNGGDSDV